MYLQEVVAVQANFLVHNDSSRYVNHSYEANACYMTESLPGSDKDVVLIYSTQVIKGGEEIRVLYVM